MRERQGEREKEGEREREREGEREGGRERLRKRRKGKQILSYYCMATSLGRGPSPLCT